MFTKSVKGVDAIKAIKSLNKPTVVSRFVNHLRSSQDNEQKLSLMDHNLVLKILKRLGMFEKSDSDGYHRSLSRDTEGTVDVETPRRNLKFLGSLQ